MDWILGNSTAYLYGMVRAYVLEAYDFNCRNKIDDQELSVRYIKTPIYNWSDVKLCGLREIIFHDKKVVHGQTWGRKTIA